MFFDIEKNISDDLAVIATKASVDSEHILTLTEKQLQLCDTYSSEDSVIANIIANKEIGESFFLPFRKGYFFIPMVYYVLLLICRIFRASIYQCSSAISSPRCSSPQSCFSTTHSSNSYSWNTLCGEGAT